MKFSGPAYNSLLLLVKDGDTYKPFLDKNDNKVLLKDNGESPDLLGDDGIYSANAMLEAEESGVIELVAGVEEDGEYKIASKPVTIVVNTAFTTEQAQQIGCYIPNFL